MVAMEMRQIPYGFDRCLLCSGKSFHGVVTGHEPVADGRHPMIANDPVMLKHAKRGGVPCRDEEVVTATVNQTALEPGYGEALEDRRRRKRKGLLQWHGDVRDLACRRFVDLDKGSIRNALRKKLLTPFPAVSSLRTVMHSHGTSTGRPHPSLHPDVFAATRRDHVHENQK
ncbi:MULTISPECIES: hypothetical protein [unclassified Rhizobium]|uniref:hypothetical protein n=1 Tax=unclassified Rhizobium TaxID=2613769 RepID=UPI00138F6F98|nr:MULTISPECIES: hypothetical protein [unclassified Rhizobium]